jgi:hypothetical protein
LARQTACADGAGPPRRTHPDQQPGLASRTRRGHEPSKVPADLGRSNTDPERTLSELRRLAEIIDPPPLSASVSRDLSDDAVLALAAASQVDLIITAMPICLPLAAMPASRSSMWPKPSPASAARLV